MEIITMAGKLALDLRGIRAGSNWLEVENGITETDLAEVCKALHRGSNALMWWIGDYLCAVESIKGESLAGEFAARFGCGKTQAWRAKVVCSAIPRAARVERASLWAHAEALAETDNVEQALRWVAWMVDEEKTVSEMRAAIRTEVEHATAVPAARGSGGFAPIYSAVGAVRRVSVGKLSADDRAALVRDTEPLWRWLEELRGAGR